MEPTTISRPNDCLTLQEFAAFLKYTEPKLGLLGSRYQHIDSPQSVSMHAIVSKFKALCHQTPTGSVSDGEVRSLRQRIVHLNIAGSQILEAAPWWKRLLNHIFRIANIRFMFKNPITITDEAASRLNERTSQLIQEILDSARGGLIPQEQCNRITSPALYKELILRLVDGRPIEECLQLLNELPLPVSAGDEFNTVLEEAKQEMWATKTKEYIQRVSRDPLPDAGELLAIGKFFHTYTTNVFSTENKSLTRDELKAALHLGTCTSVIPLNSRPDILAKTVLPFKETIMNHFCFMMNAWTEAFRGHSPNLFDLLSDLTMYHSMINDLFPDELERKQEWVAIHRSFSAICEQCFSTRQEFYQKHPLIWWEGTLRVTDRYTLRDKRDINAWLASLQEAKTIVQDLSRELEHGITIGNGEERQLITRASLETELRKVPPSDNDRHCVLCWNVYHKIAAYFRNKGVQNPEEVTSSLLTISNQNHPSYPFMQLLGSLGDHQIVVEMDERHNWTFFYDETSSTPCVRVHCAYGEGEKKLRCAITLRVQEDEGTFIENIEFNPAAPLVLGT